MTTYCITIPSNCQKTWDVLNGRGVRHREWWSAYALQQATGQSSADVRARQLRKLGLLDWRKVTDKKTGGIMVDYRVARVPGEGSEIVEATAV